MKITEHINLTVNKPVLHTLQAGRGIAALFVLLFHNSGSIFALPRYWGADPFHNLFAFGDSGVQFFFVLSGFIIFYVHGNDVGHPGRAVAYLKKRFLRIYPIYWCVLSVITFAYLYMHSTNLDFKIDFSTFLSSALLIHFGEGNTILGVAWTLFHEVLFYAFFTALILSKRIGLIIFVIWLSISFVFFSLASDPKILHEFHQSPLRFFFSPLHLLFAMGMGAAWLVKGGKICFPLSVLVFGASLYLGVALEEDYLSWLPWDARAMLFGFASSCLLGGAAALELRGKMKFASKAELLGNASYSIYLIHAPLLSIMAKCIFVLGVNRIMPALVIYVAMAFIALAAGILVHLLLEKPMSKYFKKYSSSRELFTSAEIT